ncbi:MAG: hypothetical protein SGPRY_006225, partial [Prymnesium sp.]
MSSGLLSRLLHKARRSKPVAVVDGDRPHRKTKDSSPPSRFFSPHGPCNFNDGLERVTVVFSKRSSLAERSSTASSERTETVVQIETSGKSEKSVEIDTNMNIIEEIDIEPDAALRPLSRKKKKRRNKKFHAILMDWTVLESG